MLPPKLRDFLQKVVVKTDAGDLAWTYGDDRDEITTSTDEFEMTIRYDFGDSSVGPSYRIYYRSSRCPEQYRFFTDIDEEQDFALVGQLFDTVQSCAAHFPF